MSLPTAVFLDTTVLDSQNYNYTSTVLSTFIPACKNRKLKLLLPDPTEREIKRHIADRSEEALAALEKARRTAPFLAKWKGFPQRGGPKWEVTNAATSEWNSFLQQFEVVRLGFDSIKLTTIVMNWYDQNQAPFGKGTKRKEFPDAFAIAMLSTYAEQQRIYIAVVSGDGDMKAACDRYPSLMYFESLPVLTELLLKAEDERVAAIRLALDAGIETIRNAAAEATIDVSFYMSDDYIEIDRSDIEDITIGEMNIVALGEHECTITFKALIEAKHWFKWEEPGPEGESERSTDTVKDSYDVSGTAKVSLDQKANAILSVPYISIDNDEIEIREVPYRFRRW